METMPDPDDAKLEEFNLQWQAELAQKEQEEEAVRSQMLEEAQKAFADWNQQREVQRESKSAQNRQEEQVLCEQIEGEIENDNPWERVVSLIDLQTDHSDESLDVSRMRAIFIKMKNA